jgi:transcriptional regulator with XRE-family HTH domain
MITPAIGARIKKLRIIHGHTQADLGRIIGVAYQTMHKYETGRASVPVERLRQISILYNVTLDSFFEDVSYPNFNRIIPMPRNRTVMQIADEARNLNPKTLRALLSLIRAHAPSATPAHSNGGQHA